MALATAALLAVPSFDAQALALGRVTVQSALGEPLRADIDLPEISADEVASLRAAIATPQTFRTQGLEFNPALSDVSITLQKRGDGSYFLRLAGSKPVNEPFVDVVLETTWSSGRIRRDFTMLFDPPNLRQGQGTTTAQATPIAPSKSAQPATSAARAGTTAPVQRPGATGPRAPASAPAAPSGDGKQVTVQAGDTAAKIAAANKPATVSLDQMLVAMLRSNPDAFVAGNVNRLRSGAVLSVPTQEQAESVSTGEARQTLVAQSRDFNEFRRKVAEAVPAAPAAGSGRESAGKLQAQVDEKKAAASAPDKLTLSKGAVQGSKGGEDNIARERASKDQATRVAELNRNLSELKGLTAAASAPKGGTPATAAASGAKPVTPAVPLGAPTTQSAATTPAAKAASAPSAAAAPAPTAVAAASAPAATASQPVPAAAPAVATAASAPAAVASSPAAIAAAASAPAPAAATPPAPAAAARPASAPKKAAAPAPEPGLVDQLLDEPLVPAAAGGILALLLGLGFWKMRQRRQATAVDSSFLESRLQPDSFFGASGGQHVDTNEGTPTGSSMVYSPSQLDAAGDVDPVAEADVYLAYGRDLQAEEILKEAVRINPQRTAIHVKLLEIYAKRHDAKAFEQVASEAHALTHGEGSDWARICELGQELDPGNPMYQPGGQPVAGGAAQAVAPAVAAAAGAQTAFLATGKQAAIPEAPAVAASDSSLDLDFDLDFSADEPAAAAAPALDPDATFLPGALGAAKNEKTQPLQAIDAPIDLMDLGGTSKTASASTEPAHLDAPDLAFSADNSLNFDLTPPPVAAAATPAPAPVADAGMIEFDMGSLSLDLGPSSAPAATPAPAAAVSAMPSLDMPELEVPTQSGADGDDPLATKLALAEEFNAIGDADGARSLAQEVIAEASGDLKTKAQKFLAEIS